MYKNWYQKKKKEQEKAAERKKFIDETFASWSAEDWHKFKTAEFDIVVETNKEAEQRTIEEEKKVDSIIDGTFWTKENLDFEELTDEEIGKKGKELLKQLKPFYRKNLIKPFQVERIIINLSRELDPELDYNTELYRFDPARSYGMKELIIDEDAKDIWYKPKWDQAHINIEKAKERGIQNPYVPSIADRTGYVSLRQLYEERVFNGLDSNELEKCANSRDSLDQLFFLYVIKRAQKRDEIARDLIFNIYEEAVLRKAEYWIKNIEKKRGLRFKLDGELGLDNVRQMARVFISMLITGDDPEAIFEQIKKLGYPQNIETYFTRRLGSKLRILVKVFSERLKEKAREYTEFKKLENQIEKLANLSLNRFDKRELEQLMIKIEEARNISRQPKPKKRTTYRQFVAMDKLNDRIKKLFKKYCESEDFLIEQKIKGYPSLDDDKFSEFNEDEKSEFEKIRIEADGKASANEYDNWYTYREFLDIENFTENEKQMFQIYKSWEDFLYTEYYPRLGVLRLDMQTFSNPYSWFTAATWFNDKHFKAVKNKNFTNWLLGGKKTNGALIDLMNNWLRSAYFMKDTKKGLFKDEFLEIIIVQKSDNNKKLVADDPISGDDDDKEEILSIDSSFEINEDLLEKKLKEYKDATNAKDIHLEIIKACLDKKLKKSEIKYEQIAEEFNYTRRHIIRIWKKFESWLMPR